MQFRGVITPNQNKLLVKKSSSISDIFDIMTWETPIPNQLLL